jgi:5-methylcytosine-specific restriction endonuclease McrA
MVILLFVLVLFSRPLLADSRYCREEPLRDKNGRIERSVTVLNEFKRTHPCPSTKLKFGICPGWAIDHVIPLACGGCDEIHNLQWLPNEIKSCAGSFCKDRWERKIYCKDK